GATCGVARVLSGANGFESRQGHSHKRPESLKKSQRHRPDHRRTKVERRGPALDRARRGRAPRGLHRHGLRAGGAWGDAAPADLQRDPDPPGRLGGVHPRQARVAPSRAFSCSALKAVCSGGPVRLQSLGVNNVRLAMNWVVLIVMLVGRLAHAGQERPAGAGIEAPSDEPLRPFPTNVAIAQPAPQMARIGAEILAGGIVEVGFGLIGASIGTEYDPPGALRWTETGLSLGALLGTSIGSVITGGTGNFRWA